MKNKSFLTLLIMCMLLLQVGCNKKENQNDSTKIKYNENSITDGLMIKNLYVINNDEVKGIELTIKNIDKINCSLTNLALTLYDKNSNILDIYISPSNSQLEKNICENDEFIVLFYLNNEIDINKIDRVTISNSKEQ